MDTLGQDGDDDANSDIIDLEAYDDDDDNDDDDDDDNDNDDDDKWECQTGRHLLKVNTRFDRQ